MTELLQSDHHPDADQLSAFVDHALPEHERQQTLAHLAVCQECRTIVALSLPAVEGPPIPQPVRPASRAWWTGWRLFAPAAVAFAATVILVVTFERGRIGGSGINAPTQTAESRPPETPVQPSQPPNPLPQSSLAPKSTSKPAALGTVPSALAAKPHPPSSVAAISAQSPAALPPQPPERSGLDQKQLAAPLPAAPPAPQVQPEAKPSSRAATETVAVAAASASVSEPQPVESQPVPAPPISNEAVGSLALSGARIARALRPLPSRLSILSMATQGLKVIAIDTANAVYLSNDGGKRWIPVPAQWTGRAVKADLVSFGTAPMSPAPSGAGGTNAAFARLGSSPALKSGSSLTGTITDMTGAVIAGATVVVTDSATHSPHTAVTDANGHYVVDGLDPGDCEVKVQAPGFSARVLPTVTVAADKPSVANVSLAVAAATQTVTVEAEQSEIAPQVAKKSLAKTPPPNPTPVFEITTDNGSRWTSGDGVTWKKK